MNAALRENKQKHTLQTPRCGSRYLSGCDLGFWPYEVVVCILAGMPPPTQSHPYLGYCPHTVTVHNRATIKVLIYLYYEYNPTVTEWGQYPNAGDG